MNRVRFLLTLVKPGIVTRVVPGHHQVFQTLVLHWKVSVLHFVKGLRV